MLGIVRWLPVFIMSHHVHACRLDFASAFALRIVVTVALASGVATAVAEAKPQKTFNPPPRARLVFEHPECTAPVWRPSLIGDHGGGQLACIVTEGRDRGLVVLGKDGTTLGVVPGVVRRFWWSPDGHMLLTEQIVSGRIPTLFLTNTQTFQTARLLHPPRRVDGVLGFGAAPNTLWFEVLGGSLTDRDTYLSASPIEGGHPDEPLHLRGTAFTPNVRGDIAFLKTAQKEGQLFVSIELKRAGSEAIAIGPVGFMPKTFGDVFAWSADGKQLAVRGTVEGHDTWLHVMNVDAPKRGWVRVALVASMSAGVAWAPDGRGLAYQGYRHERRPKRALSPDDLELRYVDLETKQTRTLIRARHDCAFWTPTWSAHGLAVVFDCSKDKPTHKKPARTLRVYQIGDDGRRRSQRPREIR
ncbi:MAG: hypothetical protein IPK13_02825 [Deltaproteobacteria bacterium]|nr:hypothetical protein [Deltaproteobacteria bacterium]